MTRGGEMKLNIMSSRNTIDSLRYISESPPQEHGGFHPQTVLIARSALHYLLRCKCLKRKNRKGKS